MITSTIAPQTLADIARTVGTPTYVFDEKTFVKRVRACADILQVPLVFSIKANPFLIGAAASAGMTLEVCSPGELDLCEAWGVPAGQILYSGVIKGELGCLKALQMGVATITAESLNQLALIATAAHTLAEAGELAHAPELLLRLSAGSQFGMDEEDLVQAVRWMREAAAQDANGEQRVARSLPGLSQLKLKGIHYFVGTQRTKIKKQQKDVKRLIGFLSRLKDELNWTPELIEYGPGLAHPLFEGEDDADTLAPARELAPVLEQLKTYAPVHVEMGRFFATPTGIYLTRIQDIKVNEGTTYAFIDGGINHLNYLGQMMGMKVPHIDLLPSSDEAPTTYICAGKQRVEAGGTVCLAGSLCTTNDILVRAWTCPCDLQISDILCFRNCGAYAITEAMHLFLSRELPAVVRYRGAGVWEVLRAHRASAAINMPDGLHLS